MTFTSHYSYSSKMEVASTPGAPGDLYTAGCIDITSSPRAASDDTTDSDVDDEGSSAEVMPCTCKHSQGPRHGSRQSFDTVEIARATPSQKATYNQAPLDSLQLLWQPGFRRKTRGVGDREKVKPGFYSTHDDQLCESCGLRVQPVPRSSAPELSFSTATSPMSSSSTLSSSAATEIPAAESISESSTFFTAREPSHLSSYSSSSASPTSSFYSLPQMPPLISGLPSSEQQLVLPQERASSDKKNGNVPSRSVNSLHVKCNGGSTSGSDRSSSGSSSSETYNTSSDENQSVDLAISSNENDKERSFSTSKYHSSSKDDEDGGQDADLFEIDASESTPKSITPSKRFRFPAKRQSIEDAGVMESSERDAGTDFRSESEKAQTIISLERSAHSSKEVLATSSDCSNYPPEVGSSLSCEAEVINAPQRSEEDSEEVSDKLEVETIKRKREHSRSSNVRARSSRRLPMDGNDDQSGPSVPTSSNQLLPLDTISSGSCPAAVAMRRRSLHPVQEGSNASAFSSSHDSSNFNGGAIGSKHSVSNSSNTSSSTVGSSSTSSNNTSRGRSKMHHNSTKRTGSALRESMVATAQRNRSFLSSSRSSKTTNNNDSGDDIDGNGSIGSSETCKLGVNSSIHPEACLGERVSSGDRSGVVVGSRDAGGWLSVLLDGETEPRRVRLKKLTFNRRNPGWFVVSPNGQHQQEKQQEEETDGPLGNIGSNESVSAAAAAAPTGSSSSIASSESDGALVWAQGRVAWVRAAATNNALCWWPARVQRSEPWQGGLRLHLRKLAWKENESSSSKSGKKSTTKDSSKRTVDDVDAAMIDDCGESKEEEEEDIEDEDDEEDAEEESSGDGEFEEDVGEKVSDTDIPPTIEHAGVTYQEGNYVQVASRTWPGINKPGGIGRITNVWPWGLDVKYVLGGLEKGVGFEWARLYETGIESTSDVGMGASSPANPGGGSINCSGGGGGGSRGSHQPGSQGRSTGSRTRQSTSSTGSRSRGSCSGSRHWDMDGGASMTPHDSSFRNCRDPLLLQEEVIDNPAGSSVGKQSSRGTSSSSKNLVVPSKDKRKEEVLVDDGNDVNACDSDTCSVYEARDVVLLLRGHDATWSISTINSANESNIEEWQPAMQVILPWSCAAADRLAMGQRSVVCSGRFQNALLQAESSPYSEGVVENGNKSQSQKNKAKSNSSSSSKDLGTGEGISAGETTSQHLSASEARQLEVAAAVLARLVHQPPLLKDGSAFLV